MFFFSPHVSGKNNATNHSFRTIIEGFSLGHFVKAIIDYLKIRVNMIYTIAALDETTRTSFLLLRFFEVFPFKLSIRHCFQK